MKMEKKKEITERLGLYVDSSVLNGTLQNVANNILNIEKRLREEHQLVKQNPDMFIRFEMEVDSEYDSSYAEITVSGVRLETDKEFEARLEKNEKARIAAAEAARKHKEKQKLEELATYERLKKKYEK